MLEALEAVRRLATWHPGLVLARWVKFIWQSLILLDTAGMFTVAFFATPIICLDTQTGRNNPNFAKQNLGSNIIFRLSDILEGVTKQTKNLRSQVTLIIIRNVYGDLPQSDFRFATALFRPCPVCSSALVVRLSGSEVSTRLNSFSWKYWNVEPTWS